MHIPNDRTSAVSLTLSRRAWTAIRLFAAAAFAVALGAGGNAAWAQGAEWQEKDGQITAYMNDAEYKQWKATGRVPLIQGRMCVGGTYLGFGGPDAGQRGPRIHVVDCEKKPAQTPAQGCQEVKRINQPAGSNTEAAIIHVMNCPAGEFYVYQYLNRPGFRVIRPGDWGRAIGGRDLPTLADALTVANGGKAPPAGSVEAEIVAPLLAGAPDAKGDCSKSGYGYTAQKLDTSGRTQCSKCPDPPKPRPTHWKYGDLWTYAWKDGRLFCHHCPKGHYDPRLEVCVP